MRTHNPSSLPFSSSASRSGRSARSHRAPIPSSALARPAFGGRQELGQNFLVDRRVIDGFVALTAATRGPIVELGAGSGAITRQLASLGRPLTALEIDGRRADSLRREFGDAERDLTDLVAKYLAGYRHENFDSWNEDEQSDQTSGGGESA